MDNALMLALQTQRVLQRRMDVAANNLANVATSGFKADELLTEPVDDTGATATDAPQDVTFVRDVGMTRDMGQGSITMTGNPFDVAIQGDGFFMVQTPSGTQYTRDGSFSLSADGRLVTADGKPVLDSGGAPIVFDPQGQSPMIGRDGSITIAGAEVGHIGVATFANPAALQKVGDNLWSANGQTAATGDGVVVQGALEGSNVHPITELTRLLEITRAYESAARIVSNADQLRQEAIQQLGKAA